MKILCDRQQLQEAFSVVSNIAPLKTPKPALQNVLVRAEADSLVLFATDLEMSARVSLDSVKVSEPGVALLPARETSALLRELSEPTLTIHSEDMRCRIESGSGSFVLLGDDVDDFPTEPTVDSSEALQVPARVFLEMVRRTTFAAAREETRYAINGLLLDHDSGNLRLVGTDGRRLALTFTGIETEAPPARAVVPIRALQALTKAVDDDSDDPIEIRLSTNRIAFSFGDTQLLCQLLDNRFPEYEQVIPKVADSTIEIDRALLERNVRRVAVLSSGDVRMINLQFDGSTLKLSAESSGVGRADLTMDVDTQGKGGSISFNPDYLLDALKVSDLEVIRMDMTDDATPAKFMLGEAYTYILMPISGS